ncbi:MAG: efflux RND transporter periplasmic adaptor subunit [Acidobacteria bacterium]|nr:efflux RND transporter periplasmic adaptor subunit [Acidobacteriota bacterium]
MNRRAIIYAGIPVLVIAGAAAWHRSGRNKELAKQAVLKREGAVAVTTVAVEERPFRAAIPFTGTLLAVNRAELKAEVAGRVTRVTVHEGDRVAKGTLLSAQDEEDLLLAVQAAEAQLVQAQAQAQQARRDNERAQMLLEKRSITRQAAQQAETFFNASAAGVRAAESNLGLAQSRLHKARITAPFDGEVAARAVQPGEMLAPGQPAFVVVDNRRLEIQADLPAESVALVKVGLRASFRVAGFDKPFQATLTQVSPSVLAEGRTLRVRLEVPNPDGRLKGGLFAEGEFQAEGFQKRNALPASILTTLGRDAEVFVAESGVARKRRIVVGAEQEGWRPVEGLAKGAEVVAQGRDQIAEGTRLLAARGK